MFVKKVDLSCNFLTTIPHPQTLAQISSYRQGIYTVAHYTGGLVNELSAVGQMQRFESTMAL